MNDSTTGTSIVTTREDEYRAMVKSNPMGEVGAMLDKMMQLAKDPNVDASKFETIARVVRDTRDDAQRQQFYQAKASAMLDMPVIDKRGKILILDKATPSDMSKARVQGTYAKWPDLQRAIMPVLARYDLVLTHDVGHDGAIVLVTPVLQHRNGFVERGEQMALPLDTSGGKNNTQGAGSAASYGKRHTTIAMLGLRLEDVDDDGWLMATPDEPLNDQQQRRVDEAAARWAEGPEIYEAWFGKLDPKDRAWMIQTGRHQELTGSDAGRLTGAAAVANMTKTDDQAPANGAKRTPPPAGKPAPAAADTPEGWTANFVAKCESASTMVDLGQLYQKASNTLARLEEASTQLHDKAMDAYNTALDRLRAPQEGSDRDGLFGSEEQS